MTITCLDALFLGTPHVIACYLVEAPQGWILIETGPATVQPQLEQAILNLGLQLGDIRHVMVSHIHLDHSGGAGYWAQRGAKIYVHPHGAQHLVDPSKLLASASRIYLDRMEELWGQTRPVPADQVVPVGEGRLNVAGLDLMALDTPGHASHHLAFGIEGDLFTGDVAGVKLPGSLYLSVPAPPPEFHLETWQKSLDKLLEWGPERLHLTHFGTHGEASTHLRQLRSRLEQCVASMESWRTLEPSLRVKEYERWDRKLAQEQGVSEALYAAYQSANPVFMSAQGIGRYLDKFRSP